VAGPSSVDGAVPYYPNLPKNPVPEKSKRLPAPKASREKVVPEPAAAAAEQEKVLSIPKIPSPQEMAVSGKKFLKQFEEFLKNAGQNDPY
jgi:hypothetical protein